MTAPGAGPYESEIIAEFNRSRQSRRRIILVAPTGSGKTVIAAPSSTRRLSAAKAFFC